jgi:hypothetical protein
MTNYPTNPGNIRLRRNYGAQRDSSPWSQQKQKARRWAVKMPFSKEAIYGQKLYL